ncbi:PspC domain-containing protein [Sinomicrobium weinanense]|uniref:PspC domain-containing protein n=1 Tax=Sinomicrobium weinanense TaxID=2842200 RepID=A0A926JRR1_9FLAO|nr:PspC domain-containing protein [Sinomicrobium weinanense]MBC9796292.1 PspC domain-containing protein [Sinomicrobium weinanense]MBU3123227.1 PspC domain-containing protein [Sinomicrobium weinanense]
MNKTTNINLGGLFFHIDEDAYIKLRDYLDAIKRSFTDSQGRDEIIADIEARIAELFSEKIQNEKQVIGITEVEEVISIMGQPEDYLVDEEIFDDQPEKETTSTQQPHQRISKKLFRDPDDKYIGGVSSGLGHYFGVDALWIRLLWILLVVAGIGTGIVIYILLWILVPEAATTSQKLAMKGEPANISNIEKKVREGFEEVSEKVKNVDYKKMGNKVKSSSRTFFDFVGDTILVLLKVFAKFIGIILIICAAFTIIGLFVSLFIFGSAGFIEGPWTHYIEVVNTTGVPVWIVSLLTFLAIAIPFFFLFLLGLKILVNNLKSIGSTAKYVLLALWIIAVIGLTVIGIRQATEKAFTASSTETRQLPLPLTDTLLIKAEDYGSWDDRFYNDDFDIVMNNGTKKLYLEDVKIINFNTSVDSSATIKTHKSAESSSYEKAREKASDIEYGFSLTDNTLIFQNYLLTDYKNKYREQEVEITLSLPEGTVIFLDPSLRRILGYTFANNMGYSGYDMQGHYWKTSRDELICLDCEEKTILDEGDEDKDNEKVKIDSNGIDIDINDENGENFKLKIDEKGIEIKTGSKNDTLI